MPAPENPNFDEREAASDNAVGKKSEQFKTLLGEHTRLNDEWAQLQKGLDHTLEGIRQLLDSEADDPLLTSEWAQELQEKLEQIRDRQSKIINRQGTIEQEIFRLFESKSES